MNKKIIVGLFSLLFICSFFSFAKNTGAAVLPAQQIEILQREIAVLQSLILNFNARQEINASSYIAVDLTNNSVLLQKNVEQAYPIASVTKLMNATIVSQNIKMDRTITLTDKMLEPFGRSPTLFPGLEVSAENLLKAALTQSVNDAAESLSYFLGNENFLSLMNQKAGELGMRNTAYYDVHGLNPANHSTALDLSKLVSYVYKQYPEILKITRDDNFWLPDATGNLLKFTNENNFYFLGNFVGGKSGYLVESKQTFASVFNVNGKPVAIVVLYSANRQADIFNILRQLQTKI